MSINQLNEPSVFPPLSATTLIIQRASVPIDTTHQSISIIQSKNENKPESGEQVKQAVQKIQETVDNLAHNLRFSIDKDTGRTIIKVMDAHTDEIIRQIPTEEAIEIARTLDKVQGLLLNDKA